MAKKQAVVEKEFTLDLGNLSKIGKTKKKFEEDTPVAKIEKSPVEKIIKKPTNKKRSRGKADKPEAEVILDENLNTKKHLRLVVSKDLITDFDLFFKRFVKETETYWVNTSRVHIFTLGVLYLEKKYIEANTYHQAPEDFINFISRKGNRPKSDESLIRKMQPTPMFFQVSSEVFQKYFNIIYSYLLTKDEIHNLSYSASYFFQDFLDQLESSFKSFVIYGRRNS